MPRKLKPQPVGDPVEDSVLGVSVQIFLDRNQLIFFADFEGRRFENTEADKVRSELEEALRAARSLSWIPVIHITEPKIWGGDSENVLGFDLDRYWIARKGDGYWLKASWPNETDADRLSRSSNAGIGRRDAIQFPCTVEHNASVGTWRLLEYREDVWTGLQKIQAAIAEAKRRFHELTDSAEGVARIASLYVPQLLPALTPVPSLAWGEDQEGGICPECQRPFNLRDLAEEDEDGCSECGMYLRWTAPDQPPPDPNAAVELSSWDRDALTLIQSDITPDEWGGIEHLSDDLTSRDLIVFDAAGVPFLTPKGINSLAAADPQKVSNPPLEVAPGDGGTFVIRPQQPPVQIQRRAPAGGAYTRYIKGHPDNPKTTAQGRIATRGAIFAEQSPAPYDTPFAHNRGCPVRWGGKDCHCNALDADEADE